MCDYHTEECMNFIQSTCHNFETFGRFGWNDYFCNQNKGYKYEKLL